MRSASRLARHHQPRAPAIHRRRLGHRRSRSSPGRASTPTNCFARSTAGEIKALIVDLLQSRRFRCLTTTFVTRCLEKLEFYAAIDFFLNDTAWHADIVLPGSLQEEDEGTVTQVEGRIIKINKAVDCPGDAREDWRIIQDIAHALGRPHGFTFSEPREIFEELRVASKGGVADYSGVTYEKITQQLGVFWPCYSEDPRTGSAIDHAGTPRLFEPDSYNPIAKGSGPFYFPDGRARFNVAEYRPPIDDASEEYPIYPDHRARGQPVPVGHTDAPDRTAGQAVRRTANRNASTAGDKARHRGRRLGNRRNAPRNDHAQSTSRDDHPARHDLHPLSLGRRERARTN